MQTLILFSGLLQNAIELTRIYSLEMLSAYNNNFKLLHIKLVLAYGRKSTVVNTINSELLRISESGWGEERFFFRFIREALAN